MGAHRGRRWKSAVEDEDEDGASLRGEHEYKLGSIQAGRQRDSEASRDLGHLTGPRKCGLPRAGRSLRSLARALPEGQAPLLALQVRKITSGTTPSDSLVVVLIVYLALCKQQSILHHHPHTRKHRVDQSDETL